MGGDNSLFKFLHAEIAEDNHDELLYNGLIRYIASNLSEYLNFDQIIKLANALQFIRKGGEIDMLSRNSQITDSSTLKSLYTPRKSLRKDELALILYNLAPYAIMNRRETSLFSKYMFPNFFASAATIYSTFTKFYSTDGSVCVLPKSINAVVMPDHSTSTLEDYCRSLVMNPSVNI